MWATFNGLESCFLCLFRSLQVCSVVECKFCQNVMEILCGEEMIRFKNASKWAERELQDVKYMSDEGAGHKVYVLKYRPDSTILKCYQHIGSKWSLCRMLRVMKFTALFCRIGVRQEVAQKDIYIRNPI